MLVTRRHLALLLKYPELSLIMQDALRSSIESSVVPAFEQFCKTMFEQIDCVFQKGMNEHTVASRQQLEAAHTPLALTLRVDIEL